MQHSSNSMQDSRTSLLTRRHAIVCMPRLFRSFPSEVFRETSCQGARWTQLGLSIQHSSNLPLNPSKHGAFPVLWNRSGPRDSDTPNKNKHMNTCATLHQAWIKLHLGNHSHPHLLWKKSQNSTSYIGKWSRFIRQKCVTALNSHLCLPTYVYRKKIWLNHELRQKLHRISQVGERWIIEIP